MCDCNKNEIVVGSKTVIYNHNDCRGITVDLLRMYLNPVNCCLENKVFNQVNCTQQELETTKIYLEAYIQAKIIDPETCEFKDQLSVAQLVAQKIIKVGICL